jgi:hypothetical protein
VCGIGFDILHLFGFYPVFLLSASACQPCQSHDVLISRQKQPRVGPVAVPVPIPACWRPGKEAAFE